MTQKHAVSIQSKLRQPQLPHRCTGGSAARARVASRCLPTSSTCHTESMLQYTPRATLFSWRSLNQASGPLAQFMQTAFVRDVVIMLPQ